MRAHRQTGCVLPDFWLEVAADAAAGGDELLTANRPLKNGRTVMTWKNFQENDPAPRRDLRHEGNGVLAKSSHCLRGLKAETGNRRWWRLRAARTLALTQTGTWSSRKTIFADAEISRQHMTCSPVNSSVSENVYATRPRSS